MLAAVDVAREQQQAAGGREDEHDADDGLLDVRPDLLRPSQEQRTAECRGERCDLHGNAFRLEAELVGEQHAAARHLRDREVDEDDAAGEHLHPERHVRRGDEHAGREGRQQDRELDGA